MRSPGGARFPARTPASGNIGTAVGAENNHGRPAHRLRAPLSVILFLLNRLLRGAARDGIYTLQTASRLRLLGWWLPIGSLTAEFVQSNAKAALIATLAESKDFSARSWLGMWEPPYLTLLTAFGLLTFARITRAGTAMCEDLQSVV